MLSLVNNIKLHPNGKTRKIRRYQPITDLNHEPPPMLMELPSKQDVSKAGSAYLIFH